MKRMLKLKLRYERGVLSSTAILTIGILVFGVFAFIYMRSAVPIIQAFDAIEACKVSVASSSFQVKKDIWVTDVTILDSPENLNCKTMFTTVTSDSIKSADDTQELSKDAGEREEQLKGLVMKRMRECWYMFGEGVTKVFQATEVKGGQARCFVCSEIIPDEEFIKKEEMSVLTLDGMYSYATEAGIPPAEEKSYWDYFLESSVNKPNPSVIPKKDIKLNKQYSVVYAITMQETRPQALFGKGGKIEADTGIVDCYLGGYNENPVGDEGNEESDAKAIGCGSGGTSPNTLIFGNVIDGGTDRDLGDWRWWLHGPAPRTYPSTVRLIPTQDLAKHCSRIY